MAGRALAIVGTAILVVACGRMPPNSVTPPPAESPPAPTATAEPSPTAGSTAAPAPEVTPLPTPPATPVATGPASGAWTWVQGTQSPLDWFHQGYEVGWNGSTFVLAGIATNPATGTSAGMRFWTSPDGRAWAMSEPATAGWVNAMAFTDDGTGVAVGFLGDTAMAWSSADGVTWTRSPDQGAFRPTSEDQRLRFDRVALGAAGYLAIGVNGAQPQRAVLALSTDGSSWERLPFSATFSGVALDGLAARGGHFVLTGHVRSPYRSVFWTSVDGRAWSEVPAPPGAGDLLSPASGTYHPVVGPAGWLLSASGNPLTQRLWRSTDGLTWEPATSPDADLLLTSRGPITATPSGFLAWASSDECASRLLTSPDGSSWGCVDGFGGLVEGNPFVASSGSTIVWTNAFGALWIAVAG